MNIRDQPFGIQASYTHFVLWVSGVYFKCNYRIVTIVMSEVYLKCNNSIQNFHMGSLNFITSFSVGLKASLMPNDAEISVNLQLHW